MDEGSSQTSTKRRRGHQASKQNGVQTPVLKQPTGDDAYALRTYWIVKGQSWRTEPEIDEDREKFLAQRRSIFPDFRQGIYPFKGVKLSRSDVQWLLATHKQGCGTVNWNQEEYEGIDLRAADLCDLDLNGLPLTGIHAGLIWYWETPETREQREAAAIHLEGADLSRANLRGANLRFAHLEGADLYWAHLERADLNGAHLGKASLYWANLDKAYLRDASLEQADLRRVLFNDADLEGAKLGNEKHVSPRLADVRWGRSI